MSEQQCLSVAVKRRELIVKYLCCLELYSDLRRPQLNISNFEMSSVLSMVSTKDEADINLQQV